MDRSQRLVMLVLAAAVVIAAIIIVPSSDDESPTTTTAERAADPQARSTPTATAKAPEPPLLQAGEEQELDVKKGDTVRFRVRHPSAEEVHVHGYDVSKELEPNTTVTMSFTANIEGIFEIELERSGAPLASLKVEPR